MDLTCDERLSDSPYVETIWRSQSEHGGAFISMAEIHSGIVVMRHRGRVTLTVRGPETRATPAYNPAEAEFIGIQFKPGAFMPDMPPGALMDRHDLNLPSATSRSFWLHGSAWEYPDFENAELFVDRLAREGLLVHDQVVEDALTARLGERSLRTVQRRFLQSAGVPRGTLEQIQRARKAVAILKQGVSILDTVAQAGYSDQPHLTRSLRRFVGLTPAQVINPGRPQQLSFLYKTMASQDANL
jgi:AraC-like DNA-binding protein